MIYIPSFCRYTYPSFFIHLKDSLPEEAESYNTKGRVAFKEGRYENACQQYTAALECLPESQGKDERAKYLCNRAACFVNQVQWNVIFFAGVNITHGPSWFT